MTWREREPPAYLGRELRELLWRASRRPLRTLGVSLLAVVALLLAFARAPRRFESTVVLSITESDLDPAGAPRVYRELRGYVRDVLLSRQRLLPIIRAHGLYPKQLRRSPERAVEELRDNLDVEVWRNYFLEERDPESETPRSARFSITYGAGDPELAFAVVSELARATIDAAHQDRLASASSAASALASSLDAGRAELMRRRAERLRQQLGQGSDEVTAERLSLADQRAANDALAMHLDGLEGQISEQELRAREARSQLGLRIELVDGGFAMVPRRSRPRDLGLAAIILFLLLLPVAAVVVGAFDRRVYASEDVRALGLTVLAQVPLAVRGG